MWRMHAEQPFEIKSRVTVPRAERYAYPACLIPLCAEFKRYRQAWSVPGSVLTFSRAASQPQGCAEEDCGNGETDQHMGGKQPVEYVANRNLVAEGVSQRNTE